MWVYQRQIDQWPLNLVGKTTNISKGGARVCHVDCGHQGR